VRETLELLLQILHLLRGPDSMEELVEFLRIEPDARALRAGVQLDFFELHDQHGLSTDGTQHDLIASPRELRNSPTRTRAPGPRATSLALTMGSVHEPRCRGAIGGLR
jgi:hypothetical protein